jgi:uncharacterized membrane protein
MVGFCLARLPYLNIDHLKDHIAPGEWYWYQKGLHRVGIRIHLATILPAGLLMVLQFVPNIRRRAMAFHRINGKIVIALVIASNAAALLAARRSFGGDLAIQAAIGLLAIATTMGLALAYYNIRLLQIDQHRAWTLRTMFYLGSIITTRIILPLAAIITSKIDTYNVIMDCGEIESMRGMTYLKEAYPDCITNSTVLYQDLMIVHATFFNGKLEEVAAAIRANFGMALWLAIVLHAVGVEIYLALTPGEAQRLRMISYRKQMEAGFENPGSAGLLLEKFSDGEPWKPTGTEEVTEGLSESTTKQGLLL